MKKQSSKNSHKAGISEGDKVGYKKPPKERQFGQPEGNPRHNGAWKKEDTLRFKMEKLVPMNDEELLAVASDEAEGTVVKRIAKLILDMGAMKPQERWKVIQDMINQTCGFPKISTEEMILEPPMPLSPRRAKKIASKRKKKVE